MMQKFRWHFILVLCLIFSGSLHADTLSSAADASMLNADGTLILTVTYDGELDGADLDTRQLEQLFVIEGRNRSSRISLVNGDVSNSTTWQFSLRPRKAGQLLIPSFNINNQFSEAIAVTVTNQTSTPGSGRSIISEVSIDKTETHVQEQLIVSWRIISDLNIIRPSIDPPQIPNVLVFDLGVRQYQRSSPSGQIERVLEQRMALFPQQSGQFVIPQLRFNFQLNIQRQFSRGLVHNAQEKRYINTDEKTVEVLPAPAGGSGQWLPARHVDVSQELDGVPATGVITVGTAFTRILTINAQGLMAEQLPGLSSDIANFRTYSDKPVFLNTVMEEGVNSIRTDRITMIPTSPGLHTLPALKLPWYNTATQQWEVATLPEKQIEVIPAPGQSSAPDHTASVTPADSATVNTPPADTPALSGPDRFNVFVWMMVSAAALALIALIWRIIFLQRRLQKLETGVIEKNSAITPVNDLTPEALTSAATDGDPAFFARRVLAWAQQQYAESPPLTLTDLAGRIMDKQLAQQLRALDAAIYGNGAMPPLDTLAKQLLTLSTDAAPTNTARQSQLDKLYR
jgi:hypothetical protein